MIKSVITLKDNYTKVAEKVGMSATAMGNKLERSASSSDKLTSSLKRMTQRSYEVRIKDIKDQKVKKQIHQLQSNLRKMTGKEYQVHVTAKKSIKEVFKNDLGSLKNKVLNIKTNTVGLIRARIEARRLAKEMERITGRKHRIQIDRGGFSGGMLGKIAGGTANHAGFGGGMGGIALGGKAALALGGAAALGALAVGGAKLTGAMLQRGSELQQQQISMTHFLGGDEKKSKAFMNELRENANLTPFSTSEVVAAGTRAVQITEGDTKKGMEMVKLAEDMAALNPGKTIADAMEALADAKMGEMERLKEFGFKGSKELFDQAGGDLFKMKSNSGKTLLQMYEGGAAKLSGSWDGKKSTIWGNIQSGLADSGLKIIERLTPALDDLIPVSVKLGKALPKITDVVLDAVIPPLKFLGSVITTVADAISAAASIISNVKNKVGDFFSGGSVDSKIKSKMTTMPMKGYATGTNSFEGGWAKVNERGSEMFKLPNRTKIYPSGKTDATIARELRLQDQKKSSPSFNMTFNIQTGGAIDEAMLSKLLAKEIEKTLLNMS